MIPIVCNRVILNGVFIEANSSDMWNLRKHMLLD